MRREAREQWKRLAAQCERQLDSAQVLVVLEQWHVLKLEQALTSLTGLVCMSDLRDCVGDWPPDRKETLLIHASRVESPAENGHLSCFRPGQEEHVTQLVATAAKTQAAKSEAQRAAEDAAAARQQAGAHAQTAAARLPAP